MNFNLKKALKEIYSAEKPDHAKSFAKELARNLSFRKLHPVSSVLNAYPAVRAAVVAIAVLMAVGGGFLAMNLVPDKDDNVQNGEPSVLSEAVETTVATEQDAVIYTTETVSDIIHPTETTSAESTAVSSSVTASSVSSTEKVRVTTTTRANTVPAGNSYIPSEVPNTAVQTEHPQSPVTTTTSVTEIYNTHIWKHDYSFDTEKLGEASKEEKREWRKNLYGYAQNDLEISLGMLCFVSDNIIYGTIQELDYTVIDGKPWTIVSLKIDRSYDFVSGEDLLPGDVITVYEPGGYMALADYIADNPSDRSFSDWSGERIANTVIYEDGSNYIKPEIGESYLYFASKVQESDEEQKQLPDDFPTGVYIRETVNDSSQFSFDGERFVCSNPNQKTSFTEDELISESPSRWNYYTSPDGKITLVVRQTAFLLYGDVTFYIMDEEGKMERLEFDYTDDGFNPFDDDYTVIDDENGNCIMEGESFTITWTDSKIIISYMTDYLLDERRVIEADYNYNV